MLKTNNQDVPRGECPQQQVVLPGEREPGRQVSSAALLGAGETLAIQHRGECYMLRQTRAGKLILTK